MDLYGFVGLYDHDVCDCIPILDTWSLKLLEQRDIEGLSNTSTETHAESKRFALRCDETNVTPKHKPWKGRANNFHCGLY